MKHFKKLYCIVIAIVLIFGSTGSVRADWVVFQKVKALHTSGSEIHFKVDVVDDNSPCLWKDTWALKRSNPSFTEIYQMLMTAYVTGSSGWVNGDGTCSGGQKQGVSSFLLGTW